MSTSTALNELLKERAAVSGLFTLYVSIELIQSVNMRSSFVVRCLRTVSFSVFILCNAIGYVSESATV